MALSVGGSHEVQLIKQKTSNETENYHFLDSLRFLFHLFNSLTNISITLSCSPPSYSTPTANKALPQTIAHSQHHLPHADKTYILQTTVADEAASTQDVLRYSPLPAHQSAHKALLFNFSGSNVNAVSQRFEYVPSSSGMK